MILYSGCHTKHQGYVITYIVYRFQNPSDLFDNLV